MSNNQILSTNIHSEEKSAANKALVLTAKAAFNCFKCLVEVGLAGQVGVKSK
jgi:hypothetical protein